MGRLLLLMGDRAKVDASNAVKLREATDEEKVSILTAQQVASDLKRRMETYHQAVREVEQQWGANDGSFGHLMLFQAKHRELSGCDYPDGEILSHGPSWAVLLTDLVSLWQNDEVAFRHLMHSLTQVTQ